MTARGSRALEPAGPRVRAARRLVAVGIVVSASLVAQSGISSDASWVDSEWMQAPIATTDCADAQGAFATRGEGRALSGSALGVDLDALAEASGTLVTNDGSRAQYSPSGANPAGPDAYANPLNVVALSLVDVDLGRGLLQLPLDNATGVLGQYGQAQSSGQSVGAGGYVTSTGGIATDPLNQYPELAELKLSTLLDQVNPAVSELLADVTDVSLRAGAVAGRASIDGCRLAWSQSGAARAAALSTSEAASALTREYLAADVSTVISSPTVGALVTGAAGIVDGLNATVAGLAGDRGLIEGLVGGITGLLRPVLGTLGLGNVAVDSLAVSIDLSPVNALLTGTIGDSQGIARIDLSAGTISVDTAALVKAAYGSTDGVSLNGLAPNTDLLADPRTATALTEALNQALGEWLGSVTRALTAAIDGIGVKLSATVALKLLGLSVAEIAIGVDARLAALEAGGGVTATAKLLGVLDVRLLDPLLNALTSGLGPIIGKLIRDVLDTPTGLVETLRPLTAAIVSTVSAVYNVLYLSGVVSLVVNAQNDPVAGGPEPADWRGLPQGRYDVAALRIGVLGALGESDVRLYLGRGSVGPGCSLHQARVRCAGY